jgi:hypothetical protein
VAGLRRRRRPVAESGRPRWRLAKDGSPDYTPVRVAGDTTAGFTRQGVVRLELSADLTPLGVPLAPIGLAGTATFRPNSTTIAPSGCGSGCASGAAMAAASAPVKC